MPLFKHLPWLVLAGFLVAGCAGTEQETEATETEERTVLLEGRSLLLDGFNGTITVTGNNDSTATFQFVKKARAEGEAMARERLSGIHIEESETADAFTVRMHSEQTRQSSVDVQADIPYKTPLHITLENGTVEVEALAAPVEVRIENGDVQIQGAADNLDVRVANGRIVATMAGFKDSTQVDLTTSNGAIELTVPANISTVVEAETQVGDIDIEGLSLADEREASTITGGHVQGVLGDSTGHIHLRTQNGAILLRGE